MIALQTFPSVSYCAEKAETGGGGGGEVGSEGSTPSGSDGKPDAVDGLIDQYMPILQKLGFGGIMGVCTGVALKRLGNNVAAVLGVGFVCLQGLSYYGYIQIDYGKVQEDAKKLADADGDGKLTSNDLKMIWAQVKHFLTYNLPSAGGFSAGFAMGLYYGN
eukprot:CAMPEP_0174967920 /NCGR_PEP_ID=MMETSP0004_2-20121128/7846_1 /TAXON_ID=420556 /ORGANISM="Ochromonas sp., Strain CCMP1393" /LENGTH=160 /DNA_ID=CAMNT_0016217095 /DNA_START=161 /DNA_END=643 /DNA_ORIENTATION=+